MYSIFRNSLLVVIGCLHLASNPAWGQSIPVPQWIGDGYDVEYRPASIFRKEFELDSNNRQVILKIASFGIHEVEINGHRIGSEWLNPVYTDFEKTLYENEYEVTTFLRFGMKNVITVTLGNGFYNFQPKVNWRLDQAPWRGRPFFRAYLSDSRSEEILFATDESWRYKDSPWTFNSIFLGETFDQRLVETDVMSPGYDDGHWNQVTVMDNPEQLIKKQPQVGLIIADTLLPVSAIQVNPEIVVFRFPRNIAGIAELKIAPLTSGQVMSFHFGEQVNEDGLVATNNLSHVYFDRRSGEEFQTDHLISNGTDSLTFTNRFSYKGFQYVEVRSSPGINKDAINIKAYVLTSTPKRLSALHSGNETLNRLWAAANNSIESNMMGTPIDCPTREKNGWTGDGHVIFQSAAFNFDVQEIYKKWLEDHQDAQLDNGLIPNVIPTGGFGYDNSTFDWTVSTITLPWMHYLYYGDTAILDENYRMMISFMEYWRALKQNQFIAIGLGDWKASSKSNVWFTTTVLYLDALLKMAQISEILDYRRNQSEFLEEALEVRQAVIERYFDHAEGTFGNGTQTDLAFGYFYGLAPSESDLEKLENSIIDRIRAVDDKVESGILGVLPLLRSLTEMGRSDVALDLVTTEDNLIWAHWLKSGSETMFEGPGYEVQKWYGGSQNHMYFGSFNEWIARDLAGINPSFAQPGFKGVDLKPNFIEDLGFIEYTFESPRGSMQVAWEFLSTDEVKLDVNMPEETELFFHVTDSFRINSTNVTMQRVAYQVYKIEEPTFTITLLKQDTLLDIEKSSDINLLFDGTMVFTNDNSSSLQNELLKFVVNDVQGNIIYQKWIGPSTTRQQVILDKDELPSKAMGLLIGTLMKADGKSIATIKFIGR